MLVGVGQCTNSVGGHLYPLVVDDISQEHDCAHGTHIFLFSQIKCFCNLCITWCTCDLCKVVVPHLSFQQ